MTTEALIRVEGLKKHFGSLKALDGIDLELRKGEVTVIIGPSGSGKSTLLRSLNLLERPTEGAIYFEGVNILDPKTNINLHRQRMGMVFQHFNLFPHMTILRNMTLAPMKLLHETPAAATEEAMRLLERVGLQDRANAYPSQLSGGQKQRIAISRAILKNAEILILDDATSALDLATEARFYQALRESGAQSTKILIAQRVASIKNADRIAVLENGRIVGLGSHEELWETCEIYRDICRSQLGNGGMENA